MAQSTEERLQRTVLHGWHAGHGAKMVPFGGWDMPVQYSGGIITEHLATRREAGLFDVSHMGRFRVRGEGAPRFLNGVLTNNARALRPGEAQYTLIATPSGGAVDDAYLYQLADRDYLLVVNASNRDKDWDWLHAHGDLTDTTLEDQSDAIAMIALQGPQASEILEQVVPKDALPENKRNRIATVELDGHELVVSRTGYTGEPVCFELFAPSERAVALWERLVALGATPVGLGARDSLRLEAGMPLYGHELGEAPDGGEIPVFAISLAAFAVRAGSDEPFVGDEALAQQRAELEQIRREEINAPVSERTLRRLVRPIACFDGRRPLRAGYRVFLEEREVGVVTSGTTVPAARFFGQGIAAVPGGEHTMRPIGLALIDSDIRYRSDRPVVLRIEDGRGNAMAAELVERNLWPATPFARAYAGFREPVRREAVAPEEVRELAARLVDDSAHNDAWRRSECVNLIPSEQCVSPFVEKLCVADPAGRYNEHSRLRSLGPDAPYVRYYKGTEFSMEHEIELKAALRTFFGCARVETRVVSGQMANDTVYDALKQFRNRHRSGREPRGLGPVLVHDLTKGGHLSAQVIGALRNYIAFDPQTGRPAVEHFPVERGNPHRIDVEATRALIAERRPELIVFGRSVIVHREPVREIADFVFETFGRDDPARPFIMYDGAHVLGLLGDAFQKPLEEGADVVTGSTHKTFFGPQRGVILANIDPGSAFEGLWRHVETRAFPGHVSNHHLGTLLGLLGATYEMIAFRDEYPHAVVANAKAFAAALAGEGLTLEGDPASGYTETHQVLLRGARAKGEYLASLLEANGVITNPQAFHDDASFAAASGVRMGSQEMTRFGMGPADFEELAGLIAEIVRDGRRREEGYWREAVARFRARFTQMRYHL